MREIDTWGETRRKLRSTEIFANNLRFLLARNGLTAKQLSKIINISEQSISGWMTGNRNPRASAIETIAAYFGVPASAFSDPTGNAGLVPPDPFAVKVPVAETKNDTATYIPVEPQTTTRLTSAMIAWDNSMAPIIVRNDTVLYWESTNPPKQTAKLVVIQEKNSRPTVRRMTIRPNGMILLTANDPLVDPILCTDQELKEMYLGRPVFIQRNIENA